MWSADSPSTSQTRASASAPPLTMRCRSLGWKSKDSTGAFFPPSPPCHVICGVLKRTMLAPVYLHRAIERVIENRASSPSQPDPLFDLIAALPIL